MRQPLRLRQRSRGLAPDGSAMRLTRYPAQPVSKVSKTTQIIIKIITCDDVAERVGSDHHRSNQFYPLQKASSAGFLWMFPRSYPSWRVDFQPSDNSPGASCSRVVNPLPGKAMGPLVQGP